MIAPKELEGLSENVAHVLADFARSALQAFGGDLKSIVLYGSGAEARLRAASDVNLLLVLSSFDAAKADAIRGPFGAARAAIRLTAMFLLESEIRQAQELFGQKFSDIARRHRVLYGSDPFEAPDIPRAAVLLRVKQVLLNLTLRLREAYVERGTTPERVSELVADSAGPLRSCAATLLELEAKPQLPPKEALIQFVAGLGEPGWDEVLARISEARETRRLAAEVADATLFRMIELAMRLRTRADALD
ncbi:MAG TPA: hypothetical protein VMB25_24760 [Bryobacteraceae bacterium]|nr:hypothetical protein [Bryobacteraceae bacterium]